MFPAAYEIEVEVPIVGACCGAKTVTSVCLNPSKSPITLINGPDGILIKSKGTDSSIPIASNFHVVLIALISSQVKSPFPETILA
ncbi:hypothetical protein D3C86_1829200 [compost metagenome]